ncbi:MAG TPA: polysaccharide biosynthesis/export family protein [Pyrinomonadaceae bacterium]|nr:polysaccharide biosynthesis/export family protein [Pyrinomonadaceae bacterium]
MKSKPQVAATLLLALVALAPAASHARQKKESAQPKAQAGERLEPDDRREVRAGVPEEVLANRRERVGEAEAEEIPSYNNFLSSYRLGPEDVISVNVFDLPKYSRAGIVVPPDGRIDYYMVRGGITVVGKTTQQVADEIARHLDEYIIDPKVTVSLEKAMSMRYGVIGDVAQPGVRVMTRRLSVLEALNEAGGVLGTGDKKKVVVLHWSADRMVRQIPIDVAAIEKGKAADNYFLSPGDQIFVPGNKWKRVESIIKLAPILSFARIFTGGF